MVGDGACAFRSVSDQKFGTQARHGFVRDAACQQLLKFSDLYSHLFSTQADFLAYVVRLSKHDTWADKLALTAICDAFDVSLSVLTSDLHHDYDFYHPTWGTSSDVYYIIASHCHMDSLYGIEEEITLTPEKRLHMAKTGKFFLQEVEENGNTHFRFDDED